MSDTEQREEPERKKSLRRSWRSSGPVAKLTAIFAGVAAAATVLYALAACWQLSIMSGQLNQIKKASENSGRQTSGLISAANIQASAATKNAKAAESFSTSAEGINNQTKLAVYKFDRMARASENSVATAMEALDLENRPLMIPRYEAGFVPVLPNTKLEEPFQFVNVGKMPATNFRMFIVLALLPISQLPEFDYTPGHVREFVEAGILYPNDPKPSTVTALEPVGTDRLRPLIVSRQMSDLFQAGQAYSVLHGKIMYNGITSRKEYSVTFCSIRVVPGFVLPQRVADACSSYNRLDVK